MAGQWSLQTRVLLWAVVMGSLSVIEGPMRTPASSKSESRDPSLPKAWGLTQTQAFESWKISPGSPRVVVAIVDTGVDVHHPDLSANVWNNPGEVGKDLMGRDKSTNGVDDDKNGYVDDLHGWNFVKDNNDVRDSHGHGTHIAGIIGARAGNGRGASGICPRVSLMALKYFDPTATDEANLRNTIRAIRYAIHMRADIINYSGGGLNKSRAEEEAVREAGRQGILLVAAAGNERMNSDIIGFYPADYDLPNVISVTAVDRDRQFVMTSNYGPGSVDIAAPGKDIYSTLPGRRYGMLTGTSQATAFVTGVAALLVSLYPDLRKPEDLIQHLVRTGDKDAALIGRTRYETRLNAYRALAMRAHGLTADGLMVQHPPPSNLNSLQKVIQAMDRTVASD